MRRFNDGLESFITIVLFGSLLTLFVLFKKQITSLSYKGLRIYSKEFKYNGLLAASITAEDLESEFTGGNMSWPWFYDDLPLKFNEKSQCIFTFHEFDFPDAPSWIWSKVAGPRYPNVMNAMLKIDRGSDKVVVSGYATIFGLVCCLLFLVVPVLLVEFYSLVLLLNFGVLFLGGILVFTISYITQVIRFVRVGEFVARS